MPMLQHTQDPLGGARPSTVTSPQVGGSVERRFLVLLHHWISGLSVDAKWLGENGTKEEYDLKAS